ncbi:MAG: zinc-ribbon domain-containing protein [Gemmatimonadaceae bacterium]|nr:zinc-ribbon domain-containing protein [Gemmatimonadaceae bacterium]
MTVSCPDCRSVFRVDPAKVPATGVRARCSVCGGVIAIAGGTLPVSVTPASLSAVSSTTAGSTRPAYPTPQRPYTPAAMPVPPVASGVAPSIMTPPAPARLPTATPAFNPVASPTPHSVAISTPPSPAVALPVSMPTPSATPTPRRSINPFLNADPGQRSRRLARALVSDLVAYHPQKREEGLRDGTLRQLFREDIKKSYEEYVEQVGRETAENSPHFQEALNEILGSGRKLF